MSIFYWYTIIKTIFVVKETLIRITLDTNLKTKSNNFVLTRYSHQRTMEDVTHQFTNKHGHNLKLGNKPHIIPKLWLFHITTEIIVTCVFV